MNTMNILDARKLLFLGNLAARLQIILNPPYNVAYESADGKSIQNDSMFYLPV